MSCDRDGLAVELLPSGLRAHCQCWVFIWASGDAVSKGTIICRTGTEEPQPPYHRWPGSLVLLMIHWCHLLGDGFDGEESFAEVPRAVRSESTSRAQCGVATPT